MRMAEVGRKHIAWDSYSAVIILIFALLQAVRLPLFPQFMDMHYHLLTAQGFLRAGGWVGWDFWENAPVGRAHIYPPLFHIIVALLLKSGLTPVVVAKLFEVVAPVAFLITFWRFTRTHYDAGLACFVLLVLSASFSFYLSLINHIPATLSLIFGFLALDQLFRRRPYRAAFFLTLIFYTHIGVSWFFVLAIFIYGLLRKDARAQCVKASFLSIVFSSPILYQQLASLHVVSSLGLRINEKYESHIRIIEYLLALGAMRIVLRQGKKNLFFAAFFFASIMYLLYPFRFFSAEGYLPVLFLCAVSLKHIQKSVNKIRYVLIPLLIVLIFISPSLTVNKPFQQKPIPVGVRWGDSAFLGMLFAKGNNIWFPNEFIPAAKLIRQNTEEGDIVYSTLNLAGFIIASIAERPTANALVPVKNAQQYSQPLASSKIIIFTAEDDPSFVNETAAKYGLVKIAGSKAFLFYKNPHCAVKAAIPKFFVPFWLIFTAALAVGTAVWMLDSGKKEAKNI